MPERVVEVVGPGTDAGELVPVTTAGGTVGGALGTGAYPLAAVVTPVPVG
ncbi:hypothetical protein [Streptomyces phaeochromogenes]